MPCYHPLHGYRKEGGGWTPDFSKSSGSGSALIVPCGQCIGCRLERSRQWAIRCIHEASMFGNKNVFVTLTYDPEHLPKDGSLDYRHFQLFMKRLRKKFGSGVRFYMCGEYGDENGRPHYHAILFNVEFKDRVRWRKTPTGYYQYRSKILEDLWQLGNCEFGDVTFKSAAYVARYIMKKVTGDQATFHYCDIDPETGEIKAELKPEFNNMSRRPGIGRDWIEKFQSDVYPHGYAVVNGYKVRPPRYYDQFFKAVDPKEFDHLCLTRKVEIRKKASDMTLERLAVRERVAQSNLDRLVRPLG
nr:MAG: replication initiator protein [Microvirus sp.]